LKGKVDASVQVGINRAPSKVGSVVEENVAPLEIKTGRSVGVMAHRAQTMLYTLLMEDRYGEFYFGDCRDQLMVKGVPVPAGLLYYSQLDSILRVEARPNEIRALIMARNELAGWMSKRRTLAQPRPKREETAIEDLAFLPPTIDNARECKMCYAVDSCMLYRKVGP
jgi:DNA replication ATP-dependent helicase Dna2